VAKALTIVPDSTTHALNADGPRLNLMQRSAAYHRYFSSLPTIDKVGGGATLWHAVGGKMVQFHQPITFTPFAAAQPCSARCRFCSETIVTTTTTTLAASLRPGPTHRAALAAALDSVRPVPIGLSLSGLEITDDAGFFGAVADEVLHAIDRGSHVLDRVMYSNTNGVARVSTRDQVLDSVRRLRMTRAEVSRHAVDDARNQAIMRFRDDAAAKTTDGFRAAVRALQDVTHVRWVVVLQHGGVASANELREAIDFARELGINDVVFRELSRIDGVAKDNGTARYIEEHRITLETLIEELAQSGTFDELVPQELTSGYYYWNVRLRTHDGISVVLETSDYDEMKRRHASDVVYKLVLHANGNLCGDWDPNQQVLLRAALL
jgi:hypothetical protein